MWSNDKTIIENHHISEYSKLLTELNIQVWEIGEQTKYRMC